MFYLDKAVQLYKQYRKSYSHAIARSLACRDSGVSSDRLQSELGRRGGRSNERIKSFRDTHDKKQILKEVENEKEQELQDLKYFRDEQIKDVEYPTTPFEDTDEITQEDIDSIIAKSKKEYLFPELEKYAGIHVKNTQRF